MSKSAALTSFAICLSAILTSSAVAADLANGERLAKRWCVSCHIVAPDQRQGSTDVPSFAEVARAPGMSAQTLTAFLRDPHPKMPDMSLTRSESADLAAYIAAQKP